MIALSSDAAQDAQKTTDTLSLDFPVLYGLDPEKTSQSLGCYTGTHDGHPHIQPASFVLDPSGKVVLAVYSSGMVGRLTPEDAIGVVRDMK